MLPCLLLLVLAACGCGHVGKRRPCPLYPNPEQRRPPGTLALLQGPIAAVDGVDVEPYGQVFEVEPGCHVVTLRRKVGQNDVSGAWVADLGTRIYAFRVRPGHLYSINIQVRFRSAEHGAMTVTAEERDGAGRLVSEIPLARNDADIEACMAWASDAPPSIPEPPYREPDATP